MPSNEEMFEVLILFRIQTISAEAAKDMVLAKVQTARNTLGPPVSIKFVSVRPVSGTEDGGPSPGTSDPP